MSSGHILIHRVNTFSSGRVCGEGGSQNVVSQYRVLSLMHEHGLLLMNSPFFAEPAMMLDSPTTQWQINALLSKIKSQFKRVSSLYIQTSCQCHNKTNWAFCLERTHARGGGWTSQRGSRKIWRLVNRHANNRHQLMTQHPLGIRGFAVSSAFTMHIFPFPRVRLFFTLFLFCD